MELAQPSDCWARGEAYEPYVGRWSRRVAGAFVSWLAVPPAQRWLDIGCGTGALSHRLLAQAAPGTVHAIDPSADYLGYARAHVPRAGATFTVADARALPYQAQRFDAAVSGLVLNFIAEPRAALGEMHRVVRRGGIAGVYVWDYAGRMQLLRSFWDAASALDPAAAALDEGRRFPLCRPEPLAELFRACGFTDVQVRAIDIPMLFRDFADLWIPFNGGQGPAPSYLASLGEPQRAELRDRIRAALPLRGDGSIQLTARAWAIRGRC